MSDGNACNVQQACERFDAAGAAIRDRAIDHRLAFASASVSLKSDDWWAVLHDLMSRSAHVVTDWRAAVRGVMARNRPRVTPWPIALPNL
ncbi:hypothetical protein P0D71_14870 [Paraburkholderia sp. RL17-383-BIF-A]|uniref:hypothetical protein n=1 Tax=Paraburkholderia sp. RL17-383-BIF-A TaxID=3031631 RepID=UPI0038BA1E73